MHVATFFNESPEVVRRWPMPHFTDYQEYMMIQQDIAAGPVKEADKNGLLDGEIEYKGPYK